MPRGRGIQPRIWRVPCCNTWACRAAPGRWCKVLRIAASYSVLPRSAVGIVHGPGSAPVRLYMYMAPAPGQGTERRQGHGRDGPRRSASLELGAML